MASSNSSKLDLAKSMGKKKKKFSQAKPIFEMSATPNPQHSLSLSLNLTLSFYVLAKLCTQALIHAGSLALKAQV